MATLGEGGWTPQDDGGENNTPPPAPSNRSKRRATRACDRCKHKKMRCTGKQPCLNCTNAGVQPECLYTAKYTRGKAPPIQAATREDYKPVKSWKTGFPVDRRRPSSDHTSQSELSEHEEARPPQHNASKNPAGDSSNLASIFRRTQHNMAHSTSSRHRNPQYAFGDPPLPETDLSFFILPPLEEAKGLVVKFFEVVSPNTRVLHQPSVNEWLLDLYQNFAQGRTVDKPRGAIVLILFATAYGYQDFASEEEDANISFRYFQAADDLLKREKGEIRLESVQARVCQTYYLLARSRVNQMYSTFAGVVAQIYSLELHRKDPSERACTEDLIQRECRKRTFWAAYTLDKYVSLCMGRPQFFHDDMIDQETPLLVNDENLTKTSCLTTANELQCTMRASVYQKEQATVLGSILLDLYGIHKQSLETRLALARKHHNAVKHLGHASNAFLEQDTSGLRTMFRQQVFGAKLAFAHLHIVLFRPFLLDSSADIDHTNSVLQQEHANNISLCMQTAMEIARYVESIFNVSQFFNGSWFTHYCGYTATVALYVYVIKNLNEPEETWINYFKAAEKCQSHIKVAAEKESFSQKCSQVLDELYAEAMQHIARRKRKEESHDTSSHQEDTQQYHQPSKVQQPQYSEQFVPMEKDGERQVMPEFTYGEDWQNMHFDQTAPGGGILGSMDWISMQNPSSVVDQIERWGFSSLTDFF